MKANGNHVAGSIRKSEDVCTFSGSTGVSPVAVKDDGAPRCVSPVSISLRFGFVFTPLFQTADLQAQHDILNKAERLLY